MAGQISSGGLVSSRVFTARILKNALYVLPTTEARAVRKLARAIDRRTDIGYYAALDVVAAVGILLLDIPSSRISPKLSTGTT